MKSIILSILVIVLTGCVVKEPPNSMLEDRGAYEVDVAHPSVAQDNRIKFLILHYTAVDDKESLSLLTQGNVSAHYLIPSHPQFSEGKLVILNLVPEVKRAWHAGVSFWHGRNNINDTSIGIEIVNPGHEDRLLERVWIPYYPEQIELMKLVARDIIKRYGITPDNVLGHSDIAPLRKTDPGPLFPWQALAAEGIGAWPDSKKVAQRLAGRPHDEQVDVLKIQQALAKYGYDIPQTGVLDDKTLKNIQAFQMHFRSQDYSGRPDAETEAIAEVLVEQYRQPKLQ